MTYISPYQLLDDERVKNAKLKAERDQLLSTVESLEQEKAKLKEAKERYRRFWAMVVNELLTLTPECTESEAIASLIKINQIAIKHSETSLIPQP